MNYKQILEYYSREDIQDALVSVSNDREIAGIFKNGSFGQRPNMLVYPADVFSMAKLGNVAFHGSVERWENPMSLRPGMSKDDMDNLRKGFELIIDPDIKVFEYAKAVTKVVVEELQSYGIKNIGVKYTGGKSFHIGVPFESFPENVDYNPTRIQYPLIPQLITSYLKEKIKQKLSDAILKVEPDINEIAKKIEADPQDLISEDGLNVYKIVTEVGLFTSRHMFRLPYSLNESSHLVSLPIKISDIDKFKKEDATPEKIKVKEKFLDMSGSDNDEMERLITEALDWYYSKVKHEEVKKKIILQQTDKIPIEFFPPSINQIMQGLPDGRKRSVLILFNFLKNVNWSNDEIENFLYEWNEKNKPPLPVNYLRSQIRWLRASKRNMMPPNFDNENFYKSMGISCEAEIKENTKNPVTYAIRNFRKSAKRTIKKSKKGRKARDDDEYVSG